jgi:hypothetical protein
MVYGWYKCSGPLQIGKCYKGTSNNVFHGIIDEVAIYNRTLSAEEIAAHYNSSCIKYSTNGGLTWTIEPSTSVTITTGSNGSTAIEVSTAIALPLVHGTNNRVAFIISDQAGNVAVSESFTIKIDTVPPSVVTNLSALTGANSGDINLSWTAPEEGDSGLSGGRYRVKYSSITSDPNLFEYTIEWDTNTTTGVNERKIVTGLVPGATYWLAIWTKDTAGNWSVVSATVSAQACESLVSISVAPPVISGGVVISGSIWNIATTSISVTNTGTVNSRYSIKCSTAVDQDGNDDWVVTGSTPTNNAQFRLLGLFNSIQPTSNDYNVDYDTITLTSQLSGSADPAPYVGDQTGRNVPPGTVRSFWLNFSAPKSVPEPPDPSQHNITIIITVEQE